MAADLGQANENMKRFVVSASKDKSALQYSEENLSESEENEEDAAHPFASADHFVFFTILRFIHQLFDCRTKSQDQ
jgi:hypothetical protein